MKTVLEICTGLPERSLDKDGLLIEEKHKDGAIYILKSGAVEIVKQDVQVNVVSSPGSILGEVSVLLDRPHMATVRALEPSTFYVAEDAAAFLHEHPDLNLHIARLLAARLHSITGYLVDLKAQFESNDDHLGMVDEVLESLLHHHVNKDS